MAMKHCWKRRGSSGAVGAALTAAFVVSMTTPVAMASSTSAADAPQGVRLPSKPIFGPTTPAGSIDSAEARARQAADAKARLAFAREAARLVAHGKRSEAEALARARGAKDPAAAAVLGSLLLDGGNTDEALAILKPGAEADPSGDAALGYGLLLQSLGRKSDARRVLAPLASSWRPSNAADALRAARAARAIGQARTANSLFRDALSMLPDDPAINTAWGDLFLEKFDAANAIQSYRAALKVDPEWAPAHLGLSQALAQEDSLGAAASARKALEIDPRLGDAHLAMARDALDRDRPVDARAAIDRALAINPRRLDAHALLAGMAFVGGRIPDYEKELAAIFAVNPVFGDAYRAVADQAAAHYRFEDAVALLRKAVDLEPDNIRARAELGLHLLRVGEEQEARRILESAFGEDPYDLVSHNLLQMLDTLDTFRSFDVKGTIVRLDRDEAPVLQYYALPIVEQAMASMAARYGITPKGPVVVEVFPKHDDFAVRTLGLPGLLGALGACFGRVVTLDSPRARPPGTFNWQATLWHELGHVFTLQLSHQRVPRWLTEGISVYEEGRVHAEWARDSELAFAHAYAEGKTPKLTDLNAAFTRPDTVELAYFQGYLVVQYLVERFGDDALRKFVEGYGRDLDTDAALAAATGLALAELDAAMDARLKQRYAELGRSLQVPKGAGLDLSSDVAALKTAASRFRDSFAVQLQVGQALLAGGALEEAVAPLERASSLVPSATGTASPRALLADLAERAGDFPRAAQLLKSLVADDHTNVDAARKLVVLARRLGDQDTLAAAYDRIVTVDPFDSAAHTAYGRLALSHRNAALAVREFRAALASGPVDVAPAHCDVAEALLLAGNRQEARRAVLAAIDVAPTYGRAQELLLRIVEGKSPDGPAIIP